MLDHKKLLDYSVNDAIDYIASEAQDVMNANPNAVRDNMAICLKLAELRAIVKKFEGINMDVLTLRSLYNLVEAVQKD